MTTVFDKKGLPSNKQDLPIIWVLHNMPRSGGTLLSKCLGSMQSHLLLSEIHPDAQHALSFNALRQAQQWHGLLNELNWQKTGFVRAVVEIEKAVSVNNKQLILRDWSHVDYLGPPVTDKPKRTPALLNVLSGYFDVRAIQLVRHPLDTWLSLSRLNLIKQHNIDLTQFLSAYRAYLECTKNSYKLVYEDFLRDPNKQLTNTCNAVGLTFDEAYQDRWFNFDKITGDTSNSNSLRKTPTISLRPRREFDGIDVEWIEAQEDYSFIVNQLYPNETGSTI